MDRKPTMAEEIAERYGNDGLRWYDGADVYLGDHCEAMGGRGTWRDGYRSGDVAKYTFGDGSSIVVAGGGWDLGYSASEAGSRCYCWRGAGHVPGCSAYDDSTEEV